MNGQDESATWIVYLSVTVLSGGDQTLPSNSRQNSMLRMDLVEITEPDVIRLVR